MGPHAKPSRDTLLLAVWLVIAGGFVVVTLALPHGTARATFGDVLLCLLPLGANACLLSNANTPYRRTNTFWILMAAGCGLWLIGSLSWTYRELVLHSQMRFSYLGTIAFFLHPVPFMAAIAIQPHSRGMRETLRYGLLDLVLLATTWLYVYAFTALPWIIISPNAEMATIRRWQAYSGENIVYLSGLFYVLFRSRGAWRRIYAQLMGISVVHTIGFLLVAWATLHGVYSSGSLYDLPSVIMFLWLGTLGITAHRAELEPDSRQKAQSGGAQWPQRLAIAGVLFVPLLAAWNQFLSDAPAPVREFRLFVTLIALVVGTAMVFLRQHLVDQERLRLVSSLRDSLENLKRLQSQYVQSEKLASLGQLAAGAAHEINNPLAAILGYSELLSDEPSAGPRARNLAEKIRDQARRTRELVNNLLSFARQKPAEKQLLDLSTVVAGAIQLRTLDLRDKNIKIETQNRGVLPAVRGDPNQLLQVFFQIISNAVDAMEPNGGGVLTIKMMRERAGVAIEFSDTGPGVDDPERVFDPFYTTKAVGKGSGLGLSICYGIIQEHGGTITCANGPQGGAIFRIELPAVLAFFPRPGQVATTVGHH
jgi:signal transduction histidine kinase